MAQTLRVFVTGATGLLGSHLIGLLLESRAEVVALVRDGVPRSLFFDESKGSNLDQRVVSVRGDVEDFSLIERILNEYEIDTVFHLAAQTLVGVANTSPLSTFKTNIQGTWNLLEASRVHHRRIKRILIASSDKAYGDLEGVSYDETCALRGAHPYDVSKSCADLLAQSYYKTFDLPVAITRCGNFFGPGDLNFSRLIPGTILSVLKNEAPVIRSSGGLIRDYFSVKDGAHAYLTLANALPQHAGEAFNFSYGLRLSVVELVLLILKNMGREDLKPLILNESVKEIPVQTLNSEKARTLLNWRPQFSFEETLDETIRWYRDHFAEPF